ncbi:MAG: DUF3854 domain-containing protein [Vicinamibacteria bacterium]
MTTEWGEKLLPQHVKLLRDSAITPEVARARGYWSAEKKCELEELGFSRSQQRVPAFVIPIHNSYGEIGLYQIRPDNPRRKSNGKPLKYETPFKARMALDVPPMARERIDDPDCLLIITEGARKADAAVSAGFCCVSLLGVWNFRGSNTKGGKVALADWENVALNDRKTYICFDSDVMEKAEVHRALARLGEFLSSRGARVSYIYLPSGDGGSKVGLDDYLAQGHTTDDLLGLASPKLRKPPEERKDGQRAGPYLVKDGAIVFEKATREGPVDVPLCNFNARIEREELHDDGVEKSSVFQISGSLQSGASLPMVRVPADRFSSLNWIPSAWGNRPIIYAGYGAREHIRCAIQMFSPDIPQQIVYTHLGWRKIGDE